MDVGPLKAIVVGDGRGRASAREGRPAGRANPRCQRRVWHARLGHLMGAGSTRPYHA